MNQKIQLWTVILFLCLLYGYALGFLLTPDQAFSEQENRSLRTAPRVSLSSFLSGEYADAINSYFADQFPMRDGLVGWKGFCECLQGKGGNNGIIVGKNGQMARRLFDIRRANRTITNDADLFDPAVIQSAADALARVTERLDVPFDVMITPRPIDVAASSFSYPCDSGEALNQALYNAVSERTSMIHILSELQQRHQNGEYVYYRTDHHWTTLGAYYAYAALMREWGMESECLSIESFQRSVVSDRFYGTLWSAGGMKWIKADRIELWLFGNEDDFCVTVDGREHDGFYNRAYLQGKDQYSVFLDGTHDLVTITRRDGAARQRLLLVKDSFANSLAPFLAQHFDLVLVNLSSARTDYTNITAYAERFQADRVLLIYTLENLLTADRMDKLH